MEFAGIDAKWWAVGGAAAIGGVWWLRHNLSSPTPPDQSTEDGTYPTGEDTPTSGVTPSLYGMYDPRTGQFIGASGQTAQVISTNAQWAQQVVSAMTGTFADTYDPATIALAISKYLAGFTLSEAEFNIAETAIQLYGKPPNPPVDPHTSSPQPGQPPSPPRTRTGRVGYVPPLTGATISARNAILATRNAVTSIKPNPVGNIRTIAQR